MRHIPRLPLDVGVFFQNLGSLGETGLLLMNGLGHNDAGVVGLKVKEQGAAVLHHGDELFVAYPGRIEDDVVAEMADFFHHLPGIVNAAVIISQLDYRRPKGPVHAGPPGISFRNEHADVFFIKAVIQHASDEAEGVPGGFQVDGNGTGLNQGAVAYRLMVVSFIEHQISRREEGIHNHLVGAGRAVQNEIGFVCIKHPGRMFLGRQGCSFMNEKVPHGYVGVAEVAAEGIFSIEIIENTACRMLSEIGSSLVPGAVKLGVSAVHIVFQRFKEGWQKGIFIGRSGLFNLPFKIRPGKGPGVNHSVHMAQGVIRPFLMAMDDEEKGNVKSLNPSVMDDGFVFHCHHQGGNICEIRFFCRCSLPCRNGRKQLQRLLRICNL